MTTPPSSLIDKLPPSGMIPVRFANGQLDRSVSITDAMALVIRGAVEGVGPRTGRIQFLRWLKDEARPGFGTVSLEELDRGRSTAFTQNTMGAYREPVRQCQVAENAHGTRVVVASGGIIGHVWAHRGLQGGDL